MPKREQFLKRPYDKVLKEVSTLLESAKYVSARVVNATMTATYWEIGKRIVKFEQHGSRRADYGEQIIDRLSADLTSKFRRGFSRSNIFQMRSFYLAFPSGKIQTLSGQSLKSASFPLPWSHYVRLMSVDNKIARDFYHREALRGGWIDKFLHSSMNEQHCRGTK